MSNKLSHVDDAGHAYMVDVSGKSITGRVAVADGYVDMTPSTMSLILNDQVAKGDVLAVCRVAGIMAAKKCSELIPLCHGLNLSSVSIEFEPIDAEALARLRITATCKLNAETGVEMEALTAINVALLTIYDMCKAVDNKMIISNIKLVKKTKQDI